MKIQSLPAHLRPREKMKRFGPTQLNEVELIALIIRTGTVKDSVIDISKKILRTSTLAGLAQIPLDRLSKFDGLGESKAASMIAAFEMGQRVYAKSENDLCINAPSDIVRELVDIKSSGKEHFVVFLLNARNRLIKKEVVSIGTLSASLVHPREVFEPAIRHSSAAVIVAHNHPSGDPSPSDADIRITAQLIESGKIMGIDVLDHIIVTSHKHLSMKAEGYIK